VRETEQFEGWYTASTGGVKVTSIDKDQTGNMTLWARYEPREFTITYKGLLSDSDISGLPMAYTYGVGTGELADITTESPHHTFLGWYTHESGGTQVNNISPFDKGNKTIWARWDVAVYSINYKNMRLDEGVDNSHNPTQYVYGTQYLIDPPSATRSNQVITGWKVEIGILNEATGEKTAMTVEFKEMYSISLYNLSFSCSCFRFHSISSISTEQWAGRAGIGCQSQ
jgi:uncharacterized repeat protein (TIGR02543 family)